MQLLYALGVVILLVLLWQTIGWFTTYRRSLRLKLEPVPPGPDIEINPNPELGKVRVRPRVQTDHPAPLVDASPVATSSVQPVFSDTPESAADDDTVPVLLSPVLSGLAGAVVEQQDMFAHEAIAPPPPKKHETFGAAHAASPAASANRASILYDTPVIEPVRPVTTTAAEEKTYVDVEDVIALHVVCGEHAFNGEDLLRAVLAYGLRFGDMSIFHRHEQPTGQGRILFSMAKAVEPGTFDLEAMTGEEISGVSFFLSLPGVNSIHAYDIMVDTVKRLGIELQGHTLDEQQQPLTRQLIEHYRERVQEFERRRLMNRPAGH